MAVHYPAGPWIRSIIYFQNGERQFQNDLWFKVGAPPEEGTNINTVAAAVDTALLAKFGAVQNAECQYLGNTTYLNNGTYTISAETSHAAPGTLSNEILPSESAVVVRINAGVATRKGAGRIFVGGVDSSMVTESKLSTAGTVAFAALCAALMGITTLGGVVCEIAVWSRSLGVLDAAQFSDPATILGHRRKRRPIH
jgi:hypothetical protein